MQKFIRKIMAWFKREREKRRINRRMKKLIKDME